MKGLILLLALLLTSSCLANNIEGDTNHDGMLSGSEQYLLENPDIEGATTERVQKAIQKEKQRLERIAQWEEQYAFYVRQARQRFAYQRQLDYERHHQRHIDHERCRTRVYEVM